MTNRLRSRTKGALNHAASCPVHDGGACDCAKERAVDTDRTDLRGYWAFWSYGSYPYMLGGRITYMKEDGRVCTIEYGPGNYFKPVRILPPEAGAELSSKLKLLDGKYRAEKAAFEELWAAKAKYLAGV